MSSCLGFLLQQVVTLAGRRSVDHNKKEVFGEFCGEKDVKPSQKIRRFMREYIDENRGKDWRDKVFPES